MMFTQQGQDRRKNPLNTELPCTVLCLVTQLCLTLCNPMDCSPPGSSVHGILQQEYWSELPFPSPGDFPNPEIKHGSPALQPDSLHTELQGKPMIRAGGHYSFHNRQSLVKLCPCLKECLYQQDSGLLYI